jgi:hypothetical protein
MSQPPSKTAAFSARGQPEELGVLFRIIERINRDHSPLVLVPILISIDTAQTLTNWLNQASTFCHIWILLVRKADIGEAFLLLCQKSSLIYYSEQNNSALNRIESSPNTAYHDAIRVERSDIMNSLKIEEALAMEVSITAFN